MDTIKCGPTTLERDPRRTARGRRFLRGRRDDDRTRWSNRHPGCFYNTDDGQEALEENEVPQIFLQARPAFRHPVYRAIREDLNVAQKSRGFFGPRRSTSGRDQGLRMKRFSIQQLKLRTRCARCRKLGHWARECPEGNRGQRNEERYDRRAVTSGENSRGFIQE